MPQDKPPEDSGEVAARNLDLSHAFEMTASGQIASSRSLCWAYAKCSSQWQKALSA